MTSSASVPARLVHAATVAVATVATLGGLSAPPSAQAATAPLPGFTQRLIVRFHDAPSLAVASAVRKERVQSDSVRALGARKSLQLVRIRETGQGAVVVALPAAVTLDEARAAARRLADDPAVAHAEPDLRVFAHQATDTLFALQWNLPGPTQAGGSAGGINVTRVWPSTEGRGVTVAVIDTGATSHPDLDEAWLPGYDFIGADGPGGGFAIANDGDGRDIDAADPGDWCDADGSPRPSSWHGTSVAGVIAARVNGYGIVGAAPGVRILPVRAIGRCGGNLSDVIDAMRWAAGLAVAGAAANPNPAKVLNLSLGSAPGIACSLLQQEAVNEIVAANVMIVAAAGNEGAAGMGVPANCSQVVAVAAHTREGDLASYSNYHAGVALTAPGGVGSTFASAVLASSNSGATSPGEARDARAFVGTSAATPHVAAAAALLWSRDPTRPIVEIRNALVGGARPWPAGTACTAAASGGCGAGMLDVSASMDRLGRQVAVEIASPAGAQPGNTQITVTASGRSSYADSQLSWRWTQTGGTPAQLAGADTATLRVTLPPFRTTIGLRVTVTDPAGVQTTEDTVVNVNNRPLAKAVTPVAARPGEAIVRQIEASDPDGDRVRYTLLQGPAGMTVGRDDGKLQWTAGKDGSQYARIAIEDTDGLRGEDVDVLVEVSATGGVSLASPLASTGSGGGGAFGWMELGLIGLALASLRPRRR
ncbi:MAG: S8 family serine peptidase [Lautropia sp.]|nr:S8 family serine peptidase [Lautropia sp.]